MHCFIKIITIYAWGVLKKILENVYKVYLKPREENSTRVAKKMQLINTLRTTEDVFFIKIQDLRAQPPTQLHSLQRLNDVKCWDF